MKKTIAIILLSILTFLNLYSPNVFASSTSSSNGQSIVDIQQGQTQENYNSIMGEGTVQTYGDETTGVAEVNTKPSFLEGITSLLGQVAAMLPGFANNILSLIVYGNTKEVFTIQKLLTNEYGLFDINFFRMLDDDVKFHEEMNTIKEQVAIWYYTLRNIAAIGIVIVAIYIGIRMAISTVADKKAKYKKMLIFWLESIALLFLLQYFIIILINVSEIITNFMINAIGNIGGKGIEESLIESSTKTISEAQGTANTIVSTILYFMIVYYELKFFFMYLFRVLRIAFYMVISPLVCLIYPIDRIGDGRAQAFKNWLREYMMEIFLQPIHLGLYIVFLFSAGEIIKSVPLLGVVFLAALGNGEKIVRRLLNIKPKFAKGISEQKLPKI